MDVSKTHQPVTIFTYLQSILYKKTKIEYSEENIKAFNLYIVLRWLSMYSDALAKTVADVKYNEISQLTPYQQYAYLYLTIPVCKYKKINYIKKTPKKNSTVQTQKQDELKDLLKQSLQQSEREITNLLEIISKKD